MIAWSSRLLRHARPHGTATAALAGLAVVGVVLEALLPWPLKLIVDNVLADSPLPAAAAWIGSLPAADRPGGLLAWLSLAVLGVFLAVQAVHLLKGALQADISSRMQSALAAALFDRLQALSLAYHRRAHAGDLVRRVVDDSSCLPTLITGVLIPVFASVLSLGVFFAIMWQLDRTLALLAMSTVVPMGAFMALLGPRLTARAYEHHCAEATVWSVAEQTLTALPVVQGFAREAAEQTRFRAVAARSMRAYLRSLSTQIRFGIGVDGSAAAGTAVVMLVGGVHVIEGTLTLGTLIVFLGYVGALYAPLLALAYLAPTLAGAAGSARRVVELLDASDVVGEVPGAIDLDRAIAARSGRPGARARVRGHVALSRIVAGYHPGRPVLHRVDLDVRPGEMVALMGPSGAGKSTLAALIPRLHDPWEGTVSIDGVDVRRVTLDSLRRQVAVVLQDPFLLPVSIAENIACGRPATRAEIEAAARLASAEEFIARLPRGFDTVVGERGVTLSGGQRQRLAIARALLKDAPVLVMDEPTSALDPATEQSLMRAIERLTAGRSTLVIAHRASTARRADRVVVLDRGRIAESGPTAASLARGEHR